MAKKIKCVEPPGQVSLLAQAISCKNEGAARLLVNQALKIIYGDKEVSQADKDAAIALIRSIEPKDAIELMLAAQFVALTLQGMAMLSSVYINNKGQAMMALRLGHHTLDLLMRYRGKSPINVTNEGGAVMNNLIQTK